MADENYNKRELDTYFKRFGEQLDRIEAQVLKTNGRTTENERQISTLDTKIKTSIWAFSITLPVILGLVVFIFLSQLNTVRDAIAQDVASEIQNYQFEVVE